MKNLVIFLLALVSLSAFATPTQPILRCNVHQQDLFRTPVFIDLGSFTETQYINSPAHEVNFTLKGITYQLEISTSIGYAGKGKSINIFLHNQTQGGTVATISGNQYVKFNYDANQEGLRVLCEVI
jgi:hypothetical protein